MVKNKLSSEQKLIQALKGLTLLTILVLVLQIWQVLIAQWVCLRTCSWSWFRRIFFTMRVIKPWHREVVDAPSLKEFKAVPVHCREVGLGGLLQVPSSPNYSMLIKWWLSWCERGKIAAWCCFTQKQCGVKHFVKHQCAGAGFGENREEQKPRRHQRHSPCLAVGTSLGICKPEVDKLVCSHPQPHREPWTLMLAVLTARYSLALHLHSTTKHLLMLWRIFNHD